MTRSKSREGLTSVIPDGNYYVGRSLAMFAGLCLAATGVLYWQQQDSNIIKAWGMMGMAVLFIITGVLIMQCK